MEKRGKISKLGRKIKFKMEKNLKISNLERKREFKMEKTVKISILKLGDKGAFMPVMSYTQKTPV